MTDDDIIAVVQAHKDGKPIQSRAKETYFTARTNETNWSEVHFGAMVTDGFAQGFDFRRYDYRVAPEPRKPREWDVVEKGDCISSCWAGDKHIKVREVIE